MNAASCIFQQRAFHAQGSCGDTFLFDARFCTPDGVPAISRGLSEAISPVARRRWNCIPEGCQQIASRLGVEAGATRCMD